MRRRPRPLPLLAFLPGLLAACGSSREDQLKKVQQQLESWKATERLTNELAGRGALPDVYVQQVSEAVAQGREQARQQAAKLSQ